MKKFGHWQQSIFSLMLAGLLTGTAGCLSCLCPVHPPDEALIQPCHELPKYCRDHVYVFFLNGLDPVNYGNLTGIREYVETLGFRKTYYGQIYHVSYFADEVRKIHREEPDAHFVLVGFGRGARSIRSLAERVNGEGVTVDLLVDLDGKLPSGMGLENGPVVGHVRDGTVTRTTAPPSGPDLWLFGNPTNAKTVEMLGQQLAQIASSIPDVEQASPEQLPPPADEPTPKPVKPQVPTANSEWDFLKPERNRVHYQHEDQRAAGGFSG
jgi:hypothetical protein